MHDLPPAKRAATLPSRRVRDRLDAEILQGCRVHDLYLAEYGSLGEAVRASADAAEQSRLPR